MQGSQCSYHSSMTVYAHSSHSICTSTECTQGPQVLIFEACLVNYIGIAVELQTSHGVDDVACLLTHWKTRQHNALTLLLSSISHRAKQTSSFLPSTISESIASSRVSDAVIPSVAGSSRNVCTKHKLLDITSRLGWRHQYVCCNSWIHKLEMRSIPINGRLTTKFDPNADLI